MFSLSSRHEYFNAINKIFWIKKCLVLISFLLMPWQHYLILYTSFSLTHFWTVCCSYQTHQYPDKIHCPSSIFFQQHIRFSLVWKKKAIFRIFLLDIFTFFIRFPLFLAMWVTDLKDWKVNLFMLWHFYLLQMYLHQILLEEFCIYLRISFDIYKLTT